MDEIKSPITLSSNVRLFDVLDKKRLIEQYKTEFGIDIDGYFLGVSEIEIYECLDTGYRFYHPLHIFGDDIFYERLQKVIPYYSTWKEENEIAVQYIQDQDSVLDVGCGAGYFLSGISKRKNGLKIVGLEFNDLAIQKGHANGVLIYKRSVQDHSALESKYNVITCFQVLEHISEVRSFLDAMVELLLPGGKLIIGVPNSNPFIYKTDKYHTLNCPPHHAGLWSKQAFLSLEHFFSIRILKVHEQENLFTFRHKTNDDYAKFKSHVPVLSSIIYRVLKLKNYLFFREFHTQGHSIVVVFERV